MATNFPLMQVGRTATASVATATALTFPTTTGMINPTHAIICVGSAGAIRWRADGTAPTASQGLLVAAGGTITFMDGHLNYRSLLQNFKAIATGVDTTLDVTWLAI